MHRRRFDRAAWPFIVALLIAGVTRLTFPFDGLYGQDAFAYFQFARAIGPHLSTGATLPELFWPLGYPAAVATLLPLTRGGPLAGQIVSALADAWAAAATFLLVKELDRQRDDASDPSAAIVAGIVVATSGILLRTSQVVMADALATGLAATGLWSAARFLRASRGPWLVACALAVGWGTATRWQVGLLTIPIGAALALQHKRRHQPMPRVWWAVAGLAGLAVLVPQLAYARAVPHSLGHHEWLERWSPWNAVHRDFHTSQGFAHYHLPVAMFYFVRVGWPDALFPTIATLAMVGVWAIARERRGVEIALLVGWPVANWIFISGIPYENPRFLWPALPAVGALTGIGFRAMTAGLPAWRGTVVAWLLAASIAAGLALGAREHSHTVARKSADMAEVNWIDAHVPAGSTLLMPGGTRMLEYYGKTRVRDTTLLTVPEVDGLLARECPCFYFANPTELQTVQAGLTPEAQFLSLVRSPGLTRIANRGPSTLFRIGTAH